MLTPCYFFPHFPCLTEGPRAHVVYNMGMYIMMHGHWHWQGALLPHSVPQSNMAHTTALRTLGAPNPCLAGMLHAIPGGSRHSSKGGRPSHTLCTARRSGPPVSGTVLLRFFGCAFPLPCPSRCLTGHRFGSLLLGCGGPPVALSTPSKFRAPSSDVPEA